MAIDTMKKGSIEMLVLFLLCEGDAYGYQLAQQIKSGAGAFYRCRRGSFYPLLYRLADDGFITGKETFVKMKTGRSRMRIMYHLEPAGRERLRVLREEYEAVHRGIQNILNSGEVDA